MSTRRFELHRTTDVSGVSGTGVVAEGVAFTDGSVALRWTGDWPTSVVFHDRGVDAVKHIHGHGGATRIVWLDLQGGPPAAAISWPDMWAQLTGYVNAAVADGSLDDVQGVADFMRDLKRQRNEPIAAWLKGDTPTT